MSERAVKQYGYVAVTLQYDRDVWWGNKLIAFLRHVPGVRVGNVHTKERW